jgi:hypothetical protein
MQPRVRYYIMQDDDQPVVRTVPVTTAPVPRVVRAGEPARGAEPVRAGEERAEGGRTRRVQPDRVRRLVRAATRRAQRSS